MELKIIDKDGVKQFDTTAAEAKFEKYLRQRDSLREILNLVEHEYENAEQISAIIKALPTSWNDETSQERYFFTHIRGGLVVPEELVPEERREEFRKRKYLMILPFNQVLEVTCQGCINMRPLIIKMTKTDDKWKESGRLIICGNSIYHY